LIEDAEYVEIWSQTETYKIKKSPNELELLNIAEM